MNNNPLRIMGIDPGTQKVGYGIIDVCGDQMTLVAHGTIQAGRQNLPQRLLKIYTELSSIIGSKNPRQISVENVFYDKNINTTIKISTGRAIAMLVCAQENAVFSEYSPAEIKKAVTGNGRATKEQIIHMVQALLHIEDVPLLEDSADALALAICHHFRKEIE